MRIDWSSVSRLIVRKNLEDTKVEAGNVPRLKIYTLDDTYLSPSVSRNEDVLDFVGCVNGVERYRYMIALESKKAVPSPGMISAFEAGMAFSEREASLLTGRVLSLIPSIELRMVEVEGARR